MLRSLFPGSCWTAHDSATHPPKKNHTGQGCLNIGDFTKTPKYQNTDSIQTSIRFGWSPQNSSVNQCPKCLVIKDGPLRTSWLCHSGAKGCCCRCLPNWLPTWPWPLILSEIPCTLRTLQWSEFLLIPVRILHSWRFPLQVGHLHQLTNPVSTLWDVCTLCLECLFMVLSSSLSLRLKCCGKCNGSPVGLAVGCSAESTVFYLSAQCEMFHRESAGEVGYGWFCRPGFKYISIDLWNLNQKFQKSIEMNHFRIFINLNWMWDDQTSPSPSSLRGAPSQWELDIWSSAIPVSRSFIEIPSKSK